MATGLVYYGGCFGVQPNQEASPPDPECSIISLDDLAFQNHKPQFYSYPHCHDLSSSMCYTWATLLPEYLYSYLALSDITWTSCMVAMARIYMVVLPVTRIDVASTTIRPMDPNVQSGLSLEMAGMPKDLLSFHQQDGQFFHQYKYTLLMWGTLAILVQHWSWSAPSLPPLYYSPTNSPASPCISHYITIGTNIWTTFLATHWLLHWLHGPSPYGTMTPCSYGYPPGSSPLIISYPSGE